MNADLWGYINVSLGHGVHIHYHSKKRWSQNESEPNLGPKTVTWLPSILLWYNTSRCSNNSIGRAQQMELRRTGHGIYQLDKSPDSGLFPGRVQFSPFATFNLLVDLKRAFICLPYESQRRDTVPENIERFCGLVKEHMACVMLCKKEHVCVMRCRKENMCHALQITEDLLPSKSSCGAKIVSTLD